MCQKDPVEKQIGGAGRMSELMRPGATEQERREDSGRQSKEGLGCRGKGTVPVGLPANLGTGPFSW